MIRPCFQSQGHVKQFNRVPHPVQALILIISSPSSSLVTHPSQDPDFLLSIHSPSPTSHPPHPLILVLSSPSSPHPDHLQSLILIISNPSSPHPGHLQPIILVISNPSSWSSPAPHPPGTNLSPGGDFRRRCRDVLATISKPMLWLTPRISSLWRRPQLEIIPVQLFFGRLLRGGLQATRMAFRLNA